MATDNEQMVLSISADTRQILRQLKNLEGETKRTAANMNVAFNRVDPAGAAQNVSRSMRAMQNDARNLSFQLNDITTGLLSGQSPFMIMAQQGTQVSQILAGPGGIAQNLKTMGLAMRSAFSPASLAISGAILAFGLLTQKVMEYFSEVEEGGDESEKVLKAQRDLVQEIARAYGAASIEMEKYTARSKAELQRDLELQRQRYQAISRAALAQRQSLGQLVPDSGPFAPPSKEIADAYAEIDRAIGTLMREIEAGNLRAWPEFNEQMARIEGSEAPEAIRAYAASMRAAGEEATKSAAGLKAAQDAIDGTVTSTETYNRAMKEMAEVSQPTLTALEKVWQDYAAAIRNATTEQEFLNAKTEALGAIARLSAEEGAAALDSLTRTTLGDFDAYSKKVAQIESGGDPNARNPLSSASGLYQFLDSTFLTYARKVDEWAHLTDAQLKAQKDVVAVQKRVFEEFTRDNERVLASAAIPITDATRYLAHFLGPQGAVNLLQAPPSQSAASVVGAAAVAANQSVLGGGRTVGDVIAWAEAKTAEAAATLKAAEAQGQQNTAYDDYVASLQQGMALQEQQQGIYAQTNLSMDEQAIALETLRIKTELLAAAEEQGIPITAAKTAEIEKLAAAAAKAGVATDKMAQSTKGLDKIKGAAEKQMEQVAGIMQSGLETFVLDLTRGADASEAFQRALQGVVQQLIRLTIQSLFTKQVLGGLFPGLGSVMGAGVAHSGGVVGKTAFPQRQVAPAIFAGAPRMHSGGIAGLRPGEVPAILQRGEMVIPNPKRLAGAAAGGQIDNSVHIKDTINIDMSESGLVTASSEDGRKVGTEIQRAVQAILVKESRPGGLLRKTR